MTNTLAFMTFDPMYFVIVGPAMLLAMWAQWKVKSAYAQGRTIGTSSGMTGAETARAIMERNGVRDVRIETSQGMLSDHYSPSEKVVRLSPEVYGGSSIASVGIAAHEVGHVLQHARGYAPLKLRTGLVPLAKIGGQLSMVLVMIGLGLQAVGLLYVGIVLFSVTVLFQLITLPVEFDASRRAKVELANAGIVTGQEGPLVSRVLGAAAMTYVAATISGVAMLLYFILKASQASGNRER